MVVIFNKIEKRRLTEKYKNSKGFVKISVYSIVLDKV